MSKKKKPRASRKNLIEFEMENAAEDIATPRVEKVRENVAEIKSEKEGAIKEAEVEKVAGVTVAASEQLAASDRPAEIAASEEEVVAEAPKKKKNRKMDGYIEFVLIFILGVLIGVAIKTEAVKRITIGFNDYQMKTVRQDFDISKIQFEVSKKAAEEAKTNAPADNGAAPEESGSAATDTQGLNN